MLGKPVANELINAGFDVTLLARYPDRARQFFPGANIMEGNVFDKESLVKAMEGKDIIYINLSVSQNSRKKDPQPEREGVDNIIAAARETGIKRIAYLSSLIKNYQGMNNFKWWAFAIKQAAVEKIKKSGIPYLIFSPSTFMETFPYQMISGNRIMMLGNSVAPMWFIAAADYAKQVVTAFRLNVENREYTIQGPEPFTFDEASEVIMANCSTGNMKILKAPIGIAKFLGAFIPKLSYGMHICEALNKYPEKFESEITWKELGKPTTTLTEFSKQL